MSATRSFLTPLRSKARRRSFLTFDIESKEDDSDRAGFTRPFLVGIYDGEKYDGHRNGLEVSDLPWDEAYYSKGGCIDRAMRAVLRGRYRGFHIYAHNGGRFDFLFLLPWLRHVGIELGYRFSLIPISSSIQVLDVWHKERRRGIWRFLDSLKLIPTSLDKAAKSFGLTGKALHDLELPEDDPKWESYNEQDCSQLYQVVKKFHGYVEGVLLGEVGITAPSTAVKLFRRQYLHEAIPRHQDVHEFVRSAYVGGRTESFEESASGLRYFDINSSYAAAMTEDMPAGDATIWEGEPPPRLSDHRIGFVECDVFVPEIHVPALPVKDAETGKLLFPAGKLRGAWNWAELQMAIEEGAEIVKWGRSVWFEKYPLFRDYVRTLYQYRDKSRPDFDQGLSEIVKILLNATYGKFGMKTLRREIFLADDPKLPDGAEPANGDPESLVWYADREVDAPYIMPQISAHITTLARIRLYRKILKPSCCPDCWPRRCRCGAEQIIAYTDTDSGLTPTELPTSTELGELKDEYPEYSGRLYGRFLGPKTYILSEDGEDSEALMWEGDPFSLVKAKGLEKKTRELVEGLANGLTIHQWRLEKIGTLARANFERGPAMRRVPRRILKVDGKRNVHADGSSSPHLVSMW